MKTLFSLILISICLVTSAENGKKSLAQEFLQSPIPKKFYSPQYQFGNKFRLQSPHEFIQDPKLGYRPIANKEVRHIERTEKEIIYDVTYNFDEFSRRKIPTSMEGRREFIMLYGCSFVYGNGLNDNQTLGYYLAQESNKYIYNYAIGGSGPHMLLELLRTRPLDKEISQTKGTLIYIFNSFHVARTVGSAMNLSWLHETPFYEIQNNQLVRKGTLATSRPWRTRILRGLNDLGIPNFLGRDFPWASKSDLRYFSRLMKEVEREFKNKFPEGEFIIYLHPLSHIDPKLKKFLEEEGLKFLTGIKLDKADPQYRVSPLDQHPSAKTNQLMSTDILKMTK